MDKNEINNFTHSINIVERKSIVINGIKKIENFDDEEFLIESKMGFIIIKGENLEIIKLDTYQGNVSIKGKIDSVNYIEENKKNKDEGLFSKLFK